VPISAPIKSIRDIIDSFNHTYRRSYGYLLDEEGIQLINLRASVYKECKKPGVQSNAVPKGSAKSAIKGNRKAYFHELSRFEETPVYDGHAIEPGHKFKGPAIVELATTTIVVRPEQTIMVDAFRNYVVARKGVEI
jgi:N-methylhydantoinase A